MSRAVAPRRAPALALLLGGSLLLSAFAAVGVATAQPAAPPAVAAPSGPPGTGPSACARTGGPDGRTAEPTGAAAAPAGAACPYEVWVSDQNNTAGFSPAAPRGTHGGRLLIYDGADLERGGGPRNAPEVIDLAERYAVGGPNNATGAPVVRPHMALPSPDHRYLALAFVASGHVAIIEGATRAPKALFRMSPGAAGVRQAHAAFWTVDGSAVLVANQNGKLLERIAYDAATDTFTHDTAATLDLATCTTPNGFPCQTATPLDSGDPAYLGPHNRPDNAPICPVMTAEGRSYVTLRGGGMFVVDAKATPMRIVGEYGTSAIGRDGCGGMERGDRVFLNGGTGTPAVNVDEFTLYQLTDAFPAAPGSTHPTSPHPSSSSATPRPSTATTPTGWR